MSKDDNDKNDFADFQRRMQSVFGNLPQGMYIFQDDEEHDGSEAIVETYDDEEPDDQEDILERIREFSLKPREVRDYLDRFVISQGEAKKVLSVAICDHYNHVRQCVDKPDVREQDYAKQNVILLGPTGVGKTYLIRCISKLIGVPFVKADATKFSETGYVGRDVDDLVRDLVKLADNNLELAQYGIIYVDEVDKISGRGVGNSRDVSGRGVQTNLLKLMEDTEVPLHSQTDMVGQMEAMMGMMHGGDGKKKPRTISTRHMLFIVSGAFDSLAESVRNRVEGAQIGFGNINEREEISDSSFLRHVGTRDFIDYGFEPEFIGRLPVRVVCEELGVKDLRQILVQSEGSILRQYVSDFAGYGIKLDLQDDAVDTIADRAHKEKTGARGLLTVLEQLFRDFKFELPSTPVTELEVNAETVKDPDAQLQELLKSRLDEQRRILADETRQFAARFSEEFRLIITFTDDATEALVAISLETGKTIRGLCEEKFHDYQYGLSLISRNSGKQEFEITKEVIEDPDGTLSNWVVDSFRDSDKESE